MSTCAITNDNDKPIISTIKSVAACVLLETSMGDLVIDLDCEGSPRLVQNFLKLCKSRYYTKNLIHTVVLPGRFLVTGDATGTGTGGASIFALLEYYKNNNNVNINSNKDREVELRKSAHRFLKSTGQRRLSREECQEKGRVVALELNGVADTVGSQFLITTAAGENKALDGYSFASADGSDSSSFLSLGRVVEDESNILDRMATTIYCDDNGRPYADVRIHRALIVHDPFEDPPGMSELLNHQGIVVADDSLVEVLRSPSPERPEQEEVPVRIPMEQVLEEMNQAAGGADGASAYDDPERERARMEELARQADRSRAVVLEMLGDLPSADIKAPENVLFVCKLNSITTDEDLELIFSRFDAKVKVEIVRDHDTGQSLQYAFCEFTTKEQAAQAYFKMDNALVDDRRIKVDFSQSVAKMWDRYNQRIRQPPARQGGFGGRAGGGKQGWPPPRQQKQQQQPQQQPQQRRGPPQNNGPRPPQRYNQTGNNDRQQHFARDNQNSQKSDGRDNVASTDRHRVVEMPERRRDNVHRSSTTSLRDEGTSHGRHQRRGSSRERVDERRERHGNGRENRHYHDGGGGGRNGDNVGHRDGRNGNSRDNSGEHRLERRHRDEPLPSRREREEEDSLDSRDHAKRREHKKDRRSRNDEKVKDRRSKRDERKRSSHDDDDHSNGDSSGGERRSKRRHQRDDRSSDDDDDDSSRRRKKKHKHEKGGHKERGHRHKDRHHGHESRRHHRRDDVDDYNEDDRPRKQESHGDANDQSDANNKSSRERNRTRHDGSHQRQEHSREERSRDRHDDRERKRRHRSPMQDGNVKDGESHEERKEHHSQSKSSHSK